ncbi:hypothetical protein ACFY2T_41430 [Streptomyces sp. NPDC001260]|uniref:hypothetical protein n=1 Tax=Streptomyces sp. NPDC001260 TaxID=3364551 RepID=UPI0036B99F8B
MTILKRLGNRAGAVIGTAAIALLAGTVPAHANDDERNLMDPLACADQYRSGEFAFHIFYNTNLKGSYRNIGFSVYDLDHLRVGGDDPSTNPLRFCAFGASNPWPGSSQHIKNNAASARNDHERYSARVYFNSGYRGVYDRLAPEESRARFVNVYNNDASFRWTSS